MGILLAAGTVQAGNLDSPAAPTAAGSAMYTVTDIYNRLDTGAPGTKRTGSFVEPSGTPGSTGKTLDEIMAKTPSTNANAAVAGEVLSGRVFWGLDAGAWGSHTGTRALAPVPKTGQTAVHYTGDDGTNQKGVAPTGARFMDNGNGTVTDNLTGLMWTKNANFWGAIDWTTAVDNCETVGLSGITDWRLPNLRELQSLIDYGRSSPALPTGHPFLNVVESHYWSSTTYEFSVNRAWLVNLFDGFVGNTSKYDTFFVWPVRGGQ
jgi:hypothetical protein